MRLKSIALAAVLTSLALTASASASPLPYGAWGHPVDGQKPKGVVITIHGGGWITNGPAARAVQPTLIYRQQGWVTLNVDYRPGQNSITDVIRMYDAARRRYPNLPICAAGQSAGGNLAMLLATRRPRLACAISEEGPATMMPLLAGDTNATLNGIVVNWFSVSGARAFSPALHLQHYHGRILDSYSMQDDVIPGAAQRDAMTAAKATSPAHIELVSVPGLNLSTSPYWVHFAADPAAIASWQQRQRDLLRAVASQS